MAALGLGDMADFPFVDPPDPRNITDGVRLLEELGALAPGHGAPPAHRPRPQLARLPVDPRLGRMILEAGRHGCAREVLVIAAALSILDPRERPAETQRGSRRDARAVRRAGSDFLAFLTLWEYLRDQQPELSGVAFRRMCRREYLHYLRVREWQDVHGQLRQAARDVGIVTGAATAPRPGPGPSPDRPRARPGSRPTWPPGCTCRCWPGCCRTSGCGTRWRRSAASAAARPSSPAPAAPGSPSSRIRRWPGSRRRG